MRRQTHETETGQEPTSNELGALAVAVVVGGSLMLALAALPTAALGETDKHTDDVNIRMDYGLPVHKSGTIDSMDFGTGYGGGIQTYVGKTKAFGLGVRYDMSATEFSQADGSMNVQWTDFTFGYRVWLLYPYLLLGDGTIEAKLDDVTLIDEVAITRGGGLGGRLAAGARAVGFFDIRYVSVAEARDAAGQDIVIGPRIDIDVGLSISMPIPGTELITGYRYRTYDIEIDGTGAAELETGPYIGFDVGLMP